jgi:hypothetical protein
MSGDLAISAAISNQKIRTTSGEVQHTFISRKRDEIKYQYWYQKVFLNVAVLAEAKTKEYQLFDNNQQRKPRHPGVLFCTAR